MKFGVAILLILLYPFEVNRDHKNIVVTPAVCDSAKITPLKIVLLYWQDHSFRELFSLTRCAGRSLDVHGLWIEAAAYNFWTLLKNELTCGDVGTRWAINHCKLYSGTFVVWLDTVLINPISKRLKIENFSRDTKTLSCGCFLSKKCKTITVVPTIHYATIFFLLYTHPPPPPRYCLSA